MLKKLRLKFVCIMMTVVTLMLCAIFGFVIHFTNQMLERQSMEMLESAASEPGFMDPRSESPLPYLVISRNMWGNLAVRGTIPSDRYENSELQEFWIIASQSGEETGEIESYDLKYLRTTGPAGVRCVFVDVSAQRMAMKSLTRVCAFVAVISFGILLVISIWLANWAVKPVEEAWKQQKQFVADASHELKTPLTVIITNAELLQNPDYDEAARHQFSDSIFTMSLQMRGLVEGLLDLARVDNGAVKTSFAELDLSVLVEDGLLPFEPMYFEKGLMLSSSVERGIVLKGSAVHLKQVLDILLDNAMKYSAPQGSVWVQLRRQGSHCLLSVASPGAPIASEDLSNIFKRFYRIDRARSRDGSYGLGLSIAQSIVNDHNGKIWAQSENGINTFHVQLPVN